MTITERIVQHVQSPPETLQAEVLDFVEYLEFKAEKGESDWEAISFSSAMRGMEDEQTLYSLGDLKARFTQ